MNLNVYRHGSYGKITVMLPYTAKGKPRCQQEISTGLSYYNQCDRPASFFEPHHPRLYKHSPPEKTVRTTYTENGTEKRQVYADDVLFGYCRMHSLTLHEEQYNREQERARAITAANKEARRRKQTREAMFNNMMNAIEADDFETAKDIFTEMREAGCTIRVDKAYL